MNINSFEYFLTCLSEGSFTAAAEKLHVTQQTLSAHIKGLESEFGTDLLIRSVPLRPTREGTLFADHCRGVMRSLAMVKRDFPSDHADAARILFVGVSHTRSAHVVPNLLHDFTLRHPAVRLVLREGTNDEIATALFEGNIDLAVADLPQSYRGFSIRPLYRDEVVCAAQKALLSSRGEDPEAPRGNGLARGGNSLPTSGNGLPPNSDGQSPDSNSLSTSSDGLLPGNMASVPFCLSGEADVAGHYGRNMLRQSGIVPQVVLESENMVTLLRTCAKGLAACFCPEKMLKAELSAKQLDTLKIFRFGQQTQFAISTGMATSLVGDPVIEDFTGLFRKESRRYG